MADAIHYCDRCGKLVPPSEAARRGGGPTVLCAACMKDVPVEQRPAPESTEAVAEHREKAPKSAGGSVRTAHRREARSSPAAAMFAGTFVVGFVISIAITYMATRGKGQATSEAVPEFGVAVSTGEAARAVPTVPGGSSITLPSSTQDTDSLTVNTPSAAATGPGSADAPASSGQSSVARQRLEEIKDMVDPSATMYAEMRDAVEKFLKDFPDSPEAEDAKKILAEMKAVFEAQAEDLFRSATEQAQAMFDRSRYDEVERSYTYVRLRFGDSEWFRTKAQPRIDEMTARAQAAKEAFAKSGINTKDDFSGESSASWELPNGWSVKDGILTNGTQSGQAFPGMPVGNTVIVETTMTVRERTADGHTQAGIIVMRDGANFWYLGFCAAPDGPRYSEMHESFNGNWMAQIQHRKLTSATSGDIGWSFGVTYRLRLELDSKKIVGTIMGTDGREIARMTCTFDNEAVTTGKPSLVAKNCRVDFDDFSAKVLGPSP